jgi:transcriptional regulator with XRE-family HTH domain
MNSVAAYKKANDLSLAQLAQRLGVESRGHLSDIVRGKRRVSVAMAKRLAAICDKPWHELIDG